MSHLQSLRKTSPNTHSPGGFAKKKKISLMFIRVLGSFAHQRLTFFFFFFFLWFIEFLETTVLPTGDSFSMALCTFFWETLCSLKISAPKMCSTALPLPQCLAHRKFSLNVQWIKTKTLIMNKSLFQSPEIKILIAARIFL